MQTAEGAWIIAIITCIAGIFAGLFKLVSKNGCSISCSHPNGNQCCTTDCEEGRAPIKVNKENSNKT
jgi:hypothetical protein